MIVVSSSELNRSATGQRNIREDSELQQHRCEYLKTCTVRDLLYRADIRSTSQEIPYVHYRHHKSPHFARMNTQNSLTSCFPKISFNTSPPVNVGRDSSVGLATVYRLDGSVIESRLGRDFPHLSRPVMGPTRPPIQWVPGLSRG